MAFRLSLPFRAACLGSLLTAGPALAAPPGSGATAPAGAPSPPEAAWDIEVDSRAEGLPAAAVQRSVAGEFARSGATGGGHLRITIDPSRQATLTLRTHQGEERQRTVELPKRRDAALETLALLSASLVRRDAEDLTSAWTSADDPGAPPAPAQDSGANTTNAEPSDSSEQRTEPTAEGPPAPEQLDEVASEPNADSTGPVERNSEQSAERSAAPAARADLVAHLSLWHPLALAPNSEQLRFHGELGLFYSYVGAIDGAAVNPLVLRIAEDVRGVAVAGVWLDVGGPVRGLSVSGVAQRGRGAVHGVSAAGVFELREGAVHGLQVSGVVGVAGDGTGALLSGVVGLARDVRGVQASGVVSHGGDVSGAQIAGVVAVASDVSGVQASLVTANGTLDGAQIGLVNVGGTVRGTQIGLVNVADEVRGFPVGLVNAVGNGRNQAVAWYGGPRSPLNVALKYLHGPVYTLLAFGAKPEDDQTTWAPGAGIGGRIDLFGPAFLEIDALWQHETTTRNDGGDRTGGAHVTRGRFALGAEVLPWLALFAGGGPLLSVPDPGPGDERVSWEPHFFGGVQVF